MLAIEALVYLSQGGRNCAEGCMALGQWQQCRARKQPIVCRPSLCLWLRGRWLDFSPFSCEGSFLGTLTFKIEWINNWLWRRGISVYSYTFGGIKRGSLRCTLMERWIIRGWVEEGSGHGCLSPKGPRWWTFGVGWRFSNYWEHWEIVEGVFRKWNKSRYGSSIREKWMGLLYWAP